MAADSLIQALDRFEQVFFNQITERARQTEAQKAQLLTSLLNFELQNEHQNRQFLMEKGISLNPEFQTAGWQQIIQNSGNKKFTNMLEDLIGSTQERGQYYGDARTNYNRGIQEAQTLEKRGATQLDYYDQGNLDLAGVLDVDPVDEYLFSE